MRQTEETGNYSQESCTSA